MTRSRCHRLLLLATAALLAGAAVDADVFRRLGRAHSADVRLAKRGWDAAYRGRVSINGADGRLTVWGCDADLAAVAADLETTFRGHERLVEPAIGDTMAWGVYGAGEQVTRLLAVYQPDRRQTLVFQVEQSAAAYERSRRPPTAAQFPGLPVFPGSEPQFVMTDGERGTSVGVANAAEAPATIRRYYADRLLADGWTPALGSRVLLDGQAPTTAVYAKGAYVCCVSVTPADNGLSAIALVHKKLGSS